MRGRSGRRVLVTSGPTHEPIDPVRYIANRSSGAQGTAIARALAALGAEVVFVTGPATVPPPEGVEVIRVETAQRDAGGGRGRAARRCRRFCRRRGRLAVASASDRKMKKTRTADCRCWNLPRTRTFWRR